MRKTVTRILSILLALTLLCGLSLPVWAQEETEAATVSIRTAEDLMKLAENCSLDSWSLGKIVVLNADISLEGVNFTPIPSFGGTFNGNGHSITGLSVSGEMSGAGLFRTVQPTGWIRNLKVSGTLDVSGACTAVGGIAGTNYGTITGCGFSGTVNGKENVGGIVGLNAITGAVLNCTTGGAITGENKTGGIAGSNLGKIQGSTNGAYVNTVSQDQSVSLEDLNLDLSLDKSKLSSVSVLPTALDTGGIAGYSAGILQDCTNAAVVGYPHVGYNVGGIAGRSCGYVLTCANSGAVYGRKDIGGLVGQMEPYIEMSLSDSTLTQVQKQLKELQDLVDKASKDAESGVGGISSRLSSVNGSIQNAAQEAANVKVNIGANGSVTGEGSGEGSGTIEGSGSVTVTTPDVNVEGSSTMATTPEGGTTTDVDVSVSGGTGSVEGEGSASGSNAVSGNVGITGEAQIVAAPDLGGLTSSISGIGSQLSQLNGAIAGTTGQLAEDVRAMNEKFGAISDTIYNAIAEADDPQNNPVKDTSADNIAAVTLGKIKDGQNAGEISGDLNVGGIVGSMAIEYSVDPEDDLSASVSGKYKRQYELKAIIEDCVNNGTVTAKRSYAAGIAGRMDLGLITGAMGFGDVSSDTGDYVGGIAGLVSATIQNSFAKCTLEGDKYVGGIVGSGVGETMTGNVSSVTGCYSMVTVARGAQSVGAISGTDAGTFAENFFVSDTLGGLDGLSYAGQAEPMSYPDLMEVENLPEEMKILTLRFVADGEILKTEQFHYGDSFSEDVFPAIPQKDGYYAHWDKTDLTDLTFDTVVNAEYTLFASAIPSEIQRENGRPVFFVDGDYQDGMTIGATAQPLSPGSFSPLTSGLDQAIRGYTKENPWYTWLSAPINKDIVEQWRISLPSDGQSSHLIHYLSPNGSTSHLRLYVKQGDRWERIEYEVFGSYLTFELAGTEAELAVVSILHIWWTWLVLAAVIGLIVFLILMLTRKARKRRRMKKAAMRDAEAAAAAESGEAPVPQKKKKKWVLPLVIVLVVLAVAGGVLGFLLPTLKGTLAPYRALNELNQKAELSMGLTVDGSLGQDSFHTEAEINRRTTGGHKITCVSVDGTALYYSEDRVLLENGNAYKLGGDLPNFSSLLGQIVPLYQDLEVTEHSQDGVKTYSVTASGETEGKLLALLAPEIGDHISQTQQLTVSVELSGTKAQKVTMEASGALTDDGKTPFELTAVLTPRERSVSFPVPQAVLDTLDQSADPDAVEITQDLFSLAVGWAELRSRDPMSARVSLSADCGPVVVSSSLGLTAQNVNGQRIQSVSKNGLRLYFTDKAVVNENGVGVTSQESALTDTSKLLDLAYTVCLNGQFSKAESEGSTAYIVSLDEEAMTELLGIIAPEAEKLDISMTTGTLTLRMSGDIITGIDVTCSGSAKVVLATVQVSLSGAVTFTQEEVPDVPDAVASALLK